MSRGEVDYRTRSFAAYGLGLVAWATSDVDLKQNCFEILRSVVEDESIASRDVRVAAINGLSLLAPNPNAADDKERKLLDGCLETLKDYFGRPLGAGEELIQAHVPTAIAKLLTRDGPEELVRPYKELFLDELRGKGRGNNIQRSAALALGMLSRPGEVAY